MLDHKTIVVAVLAGAVSVSAHGYIAEVNIDGVAHVGFNPAAAPYGPQPDSISWANGATDLGFVPSSSAQEADVICHLDAANGILTAPVAAGSTIELTWTEWPDSHKGPIIDYLADCGGDCTTVDKASLEWFKIAEVAQLELGAGNGVTGKWAPDVLREDNHIWPVTIPASIKPGNYVLRHEIIALHNGGTEGETQLYPQCMNLEITGEGTESPEGVLGTELYTPTDPGILYNIYDDQTNPTYVIPGPPLYEG
ncbi:glycoside hydrolase family 61 protein [Candidatus Bathyarchaeota archaeon]|nr:glycoside hydrolase family 61 protein [Candidatus Bathyarchaeota archaeon]